MFAAFFINPTNMPCAINSGYTIDNCGASVGGVEVVYVIENSNLYDASGNFLVTEVSGTVTALSKVAGARFWKIQVPKAVANTGNEGTGSEENGTFFYTHTVTLPLNRRDADTRNFVKALSKNLLTFVVKEMDGIYKMFGAAQGMRLTTAPGGSGTAAGDRNGYLLTFSSVERDDFLVVPANIAATLETPGT